MIKQSFGQWTSLEDSFIKVLSDSQEQGMGESLVNLEPSEEIQLQSLKEFLQKIEDEATNMNSEVLKKELTVMSGDEEPRKLWVETQLIRWMGREASLNTFVDNTEVIKAESLKAKDKGHKIAKFSV